MYDYVIVGSGLSGLNTARLLSEKYNNKKICILEKNKRIGGLIQTKHFAITKKNKNIKNKTRKKKHKIKYEAGGAVLFDYQKNMLNLVKKYNIKTKKISLDKKGRHNKNFYDGKKRKYPLGKNTMDKYYNLIKKVFSYMDNKSNSYCRKFTFEQICLQVISFEETRFIEYCYGYSGEFRIGNAVISRKNIENELFNSKHMLFFKDGYSNIVKSLHNSIKNKVKIKKATMLKKFSNKKDIYYLELDNGTILKTKNLILAIPKEALKKLCSSFTSNELSLFDSVGSSSLTRIFAKYNMNYKKNNWVKNINFSTIKNPIRQMIPTSKKNGIIQYYSDWYFADYWGSLNNNKTIDILTNMLQETMYNKISKPQSIKKHYWKNAVHFWKSNINEKKICKEIMFLRKNVFIVGESFSLNQGWGEGAIQTSIELVKKL